MNGRCGTGQVIDLIHGQAHGIDDVVLDEPEPGIADQVDDVLPAAGKEIVEALDIVPLSDQTIAEVGTEKTGTAGDEDTLHDMGLLMLLVVRADITEIFQVFFSFLLVPPDAARRKYIS